MKTDSVFEKLDKFLKSEEGEKSFNKYLDDIHRKNEIRNSQLERFHKYYNFHIVIKKIIKKYDSEEYSKRWLSRGIEPPETLYWFLFRYAEKYGREATTQEYSDFGNMFTSEMYYINKYFFNKMDGQGSVIKIHYHINI